MPVKLKTIYEKVEEIPEGYTDLYSERGGRFELTSVEGVKTQADIDRINAALAKERADHKAAREKLQKFGEIDPDTIPATLEELADAKARLESITKDGKINEEKVNERIEAAVNRAVGPLQRDKAAVERQLEAQRKATAEKEQAVSALEQSIRETKIKNALRDAAIGQKVVATAIDDAVLVGASMFEITEGGAILTKDGVGVTPGLAPNEWYKDMMERRPHWWPASVGGGSRGGSGGPSTGRDNPWSAEGWNITAQGQVVRSQGEAKASEMAARVGSRLGATKPPATKAAA
jgi:hypothetical protein